MVESDDDNFISSKNSAPTKVIGTSFGWSGERFFLAFSFAERLRKCHLVSLSRMKHF